MNKDTFEYAIKKDVRNNPIFHQVDKRREREQWSQAVIFILIAVVVLIWGWQRNLLLRRGYDLQGLQSKLARELEKTKSLRLEIETFRSPARIETIARRDLHMRPIGPGDAIVVERTAAPAALPSAVVARR